MRNNLFILCLLTLPVLGIAQPRPAFPYLDMSWSVAYSLKSERLPEGGFYVPLMFLGRYEVWRWKNLSVYGEWQTSQARFYTLRASNYEFGFNGGFAYHVQLGKRLQLQAAVGSGPYYISVRTTRQANGFIFSDNFQMGLVYYAPRLHTIVHLMARYRHVSNAGLEEPNGGIDNGFLVFGISRGF